MNRREELKALLVSALDSEQGLIFAVEGSEANRRQLCLAALSAAKRELLPDEPRVLDLVFKAVPGTKDQIAIVRLKGNSLDHK